MRRLLRWGCLFLAFLLVGYALLRWGGWWKVADVKVIGAHRLSPESLTELTQIVQSANMLRLDIRGVRDRAEADRWVKEVRVECDYLSRTVVIYITEREPVARVGLEGDIEAWVDAEGVLLQSQPLEGAVLRGVRPHWGRVSGEVVAAARALERLDPQLLSLFPTFDATDPDCVVASCHCGTVVRCGPISTLPEKLAILSELWEQHVRGKIDLTAYAEVDLRWDGEIVLKPR